jgi:hypothetical protein
LNKLHSFASFGLCGGFVWLANVCNVCRLKIELKKERWGKIKNTEALALVSAKGLLVCVQLQQIVSQVKVSRKGGLKVKSFIVQMSAR